MSRVFAVVVLAAFTGLCSGGSSRSVKPRRGDFTSPTHIGWVHVILDVRKVNGRRQLLGVRTWVDGKPLAWPVSAALQIPEPKIQQMQLVSTASFTCFDDDCVDDSPAFLIIPYGKPVKRDDEKMHPVTGNSPCHDSFLAIDIYPGQFGRITQFICNETGQEDRVLFEPS